MKITTSIKNYKCITNYDLDVKDANLIIVSAKNERGKTSLITFFRELIEAKKLTPNPLKNGEKEGGGTAVIIDKDGNEVTITVTIDRDNKYKFTLIDHNGKKITSQKSIREVMGISTYMTVDEFTRNCLTAKGKRDILEKLIYKLLPVEDMQEVLKIDNELTTNSALYSTIHNTKKEIEALNIKKEAISLTAEEKEIIASESECAAKMAENNRIIKSYEKQKEIERKRENVLELKEEATNKWKQDLELAKERYANEIRIARDNLNLKTKKIEALEKEVENETITAAPCDDAKYNAAKQELEKLKDGQSKIDYVKEKHNNIKAIDNNLDILLGNLLLKERQKETLKNRKMDILKKIDVDGITFDEQSFYIDGYEIDDTQLSESKRAMVLIQLLCRKELNETPLLFVGSISIFDKERVKKVIQICKQNGKMPFFEKVGDTDDITVFTEIEEVY